MTNAFRDENPYQSPIIRAELADDRQPVIKRKKRNPLLALLFLGFATPLLVGSILLWLALMSKVRESPMPADGVFFVSILFVITAILWLVPFLCLKELGLWAIGR